MLGDWRLELLDASGYPPEEAPRTTRTLSPRPNTGPSSQARPACSARIPGSRSRPRRRAGIRSARFGGDDPVGRLLGELRDVEGDGRRARYICELVALAPSGEELRGTGVLDGRIAVEPRGDEGFGYDPIFIPVGEEQTVAELGNEWKAENSHRARAAPETCSGPSTSANGGSGRVSGSGTETRPGRTSGDPGAS